MYKTWPYGYIFDLRLKMSRTTILGENMKISNASDFGIVIRNRRKELKYTQAYLAEYTGFSVSFISDLERGKATAELGKAIYLMNLLGMDLTVKKRG